MKLIRHLWMVMLIKKKQTQQRQTKKLEKIYKQKIDDLNEFKKSILQKAFNGELVTDTIEIPS
jgi:type I restriction enzyme S subunit